MSQDNNADLNHQLVVPGGQGVQAGDNNRQFNQFIQTYIDNRSIPSGPIIASAHVEESERVISQDGERSSDGGIVTRVPRTDAEQEQLLRLRPEGWEYLYLSARLLCERDSIEAKFRDFQIGFATPSSEVVGRQDIFNYISEAARRASQIMTNLTRAMSASAQENALGSLGRAGDPAVITHLASHWNGFYEGLINWAVRLRSANVPLGCENAVELLAKIADVPIRDYRKFVDDLVANNDELPRLVAAGENVHIDLTLKMVIPDDVSRALSVELDRLAELYIGQ